MKAACLLLLALNPSAAYIVVPSPALATANTDSGRASVLMQQPRMRPPPKDEDDDSKSAEQRERDALYAGPSFELDATTITALLGAAIAFQFFVLGNL